MPQQRVVLPGAGIPLRDSLVGHVGSLPLREELMQPPRLDERRWVGMQWNLQLTERVHGQLPVRRRQVGEPMDGGGSLCCGGRFGM